MSTDGVLLEAWERGCTLARAARSLPLLAALGDDAVDQLAALPLGERDRRLLTVRRRLFGDRFVGLAACERCAEDIEVVFDAAALPASAASEATSIRVGSDEIRVPTTFDLVAAAAAHDVDDARAILLTRCVGPGREPDAYAAAAAALAAVELQTSIATTCTRCGAGVTLDFDIEAFLWSEFEAWARRALRTVATLARTFGWSEQAILDMTPWRREAYLRLAST